MNQEQIKIVGAHEHNLKHLNLKLNKYSFIVITGVSGSGKSSLAFDTIHKSGKKKYLETLQFSNRALSELLKEPKVERIENLGPTIALKQCSFRASPKATLGTETGIYPLLCALWANEATLYCPNSKKKMQKSSLQMVYDSVIAHYLQQEIEILSPIKKSKEISLNTYLNELYMQGFLRVRIAGQILRLSEDLSIQEDVHELDVVIDRLTVDEARSDRLKSSLGLALQIANGLVVILKGSKERLYSDALYSPTSKEYYKMPTPESYNFQSPNTSCQECSGYGCVFTFDRNKIIESDKSIEEDFCSIAPSFNTIKWSNIYRNLARIYKFKTTTPFKKLSKQLQDILLNGTGQKWHEMLFYHPEKELEWSEYVRFDGIISIAKKRLEKASSKAYRDKVHALMHKSVCPSCKGSRLKPLPSAATLENLTLHGFCSLEITDALKWILKCENRCDRALEYLFTRIKEGLEVLIDLGLDYLFLDRDFATLSTGEAARTRVTHQIASKFSNTTYILDEPSIGLHPQDNQTLIRALKRLQQNSNTLIVVEHDQEVMMAADYIIDLGPSGGSKGGQIVFNGKTEQLLKANTLTADYLTKKRVVATKPNKFKAQNFIHLKKCNLYNLKNISVKVPMHAMCVVTGVCGSGKSTLVFKELYRSLQENSCKVDINIDRVYCIDQSPVTKSCRSSLSTYIKVFDDIRCFFSNLKSSQIRNFTKSHFSFNTKSESCSNCGGLGYINSKNPLVDSISCPYCKGQQFSKAILDITYKNKNIAEILEMTVLEAYEHFDGITPITQKLALLIEIGLEYLTLKQQTGSLSGGEAQRLKLSRTLVKKTNSHCLYLFDEPTTGLHFHDIAKLIVTFRKLVQEGHSVIIIEHNLDLIASCEHLIELGPKGGALGGQILYSGAVHKIPKTTPTGKFYHNLTEPHPTHEIHKPHKQQIECRGVREKRESPIDITIPYNTIVHLKGSKQTKKTTFAKETLYYSAYQAYYQTLSPIEKSLIKPVTPAKVDLINNLLPTIYCEKKEASRNPRSTLGTFSGIYDLMRILWANMADHYCPKSHEKLISVDEEYILTSLLERFYGKKCYILAPIQKKGLDQKLELKHLQSLGFTRIRLDGVTKRIDELGELNTNIVHDLKLVLDCLTIKEQNRARLVESLKQASEYENNQLHLIVDEVEESYYLDFCAPKSAMSYEPLTEASFSFNDEKGMCQSCRGRGSIYALDLREDSELLQYTAQGFLSLFLQENLSKRALKLIMTTFKRAKCPFNRPLSALTKDQLNFVLEGNCKKRAHLQDKELTFIGLHAIIKEHIFKNLSIYETAHHLLEARTCKECQGTRLNPLARASKINGKSIVESCQMPLDQLQIFIEALTPPDSLKAVIQKIKHDLTTAMSLNLKKLSLARSLSTLSSSEIQKFNLSRVLSTKTTNTLFVFDNPTHALTTDDINVLKQRLIGLKKQGNTLILISNEERLLDVIEHTIELDRESPLNELKRIGSYNNKITIQNKNNRNEISLAFAAINLFQGGPTEYKTSIVKKVLKQGFDQLLSSRALCIPFTFTGHKHIQACLYMDSRHESQTSRSDVATFLGIAPKLRIFFASLPSSKIKGLSAANFSYNHRLGMCKTCRGLGVETLYLNNNEKSEKICSECNGLKLNKISVAITYKGLSFFEILSKPIHELKNLLINERGIQNSCRLLESFCLDKLKLSTKLQNLSSSETSLIYLIDLLRRKKKNSLIILDTITTSFDKATFEAFCSYIQMLTSQGHTIVLLETNPLFKNIAHYTVENNGFFTSHDL